MAMYGYLWLCRAIYGCVWLCMAMYGYVGLCRAMYGCVGLCIAVYGYVSGAPNENIVENPLNIALLNVFWYFNGRYRHIFIP